MARTDEQMYENGSGWLAFAGIALIFAGCMRVFDGIWAFRYNGTLPSGLQNALFGHSLTTYGVIYLVVAAILIVTGIGVLYRVQFARWLGVVGAAIGGLSAMTWLPYYPIWSLVYIAMAVVVMYALIAHGGLEFATAPETERRSAPGPTTQPLAPSGGGGGN
ncbi:MAG: hypothetical protein J2P17_17835 [Mycobacterium sp.]|nr:hypothetical protein [Mycobacterium sp.]